MDWSCSVGHSVEWASVSPSFNDGVPSRLECSCSWYYRDRIDSCYHMYNNILFVFISYSVSASFSLFFLFLSLPSELFDVWSIFCRRGPLPVLSHLLSMTGARMYANSADRIYFKGGGGYRMISRGNWRWSKRHRQLGMQQMINGMNTWMEMIRCGGERLSRSSTTMHTDPENGNFFFGSPYFEKPTLFLFSSTQSRINRSRKTLHRFFYENILSISSPNFHGHCLFPREMNILMVKREYHIHVWKRNWKWVQTRSAHLQLFWSPALEFHHVEPIANHRLPTLSLFLTQPNHSENFSQPHCPQESFPKAIAYRFWYANLPFTSNTFSHRYHLFPSSPTDCPQLLLFTFPPYQITIMESSSTQTNTGFGFSIPDNPNFNSRFDQNAPHLNSLHRIKKFVQQHWLHSYPFVRTNWRIHIQLLQQVLLLEPKEIIENEQKPVDSSRPDNENEYKQGFGPHMSNSD